MFTAMRCHRWMCCHGEILINKTYLINNNVSVIHRVRYNVPLFKVGTVLTLDAFMWTRELNRDYIAQRDYVLMGAILYLSTVEIIKWCGIIGWASDTLFHRDIERQLCVKITAIAIKRLDRFKQNFAHRLTDGESQLRSSIGNIIKRVENGGHLKYFKSSCVLNGSLLSNSW